MSHYSFAGAGRRRLRRSLLAAMAGVAIVLSPAISSATNDACGMVYLVNTQNELLRLRRSVDFFERNAERDREGRAKIRARTPIAGLAHGEVLVGIDFRPSNGVLYGIGRIGSESVGQLYTVDLGSGLATPVGSRSIPLNGAAFGVDFNPVPDLLRLVSDTGQNVRIRPNDGTVAGTDTNLAYPAAGDPNATRVARVVAVAYTNPDSDPQTNTVLHDLDVNRAGEQDRDGDGLAIQVPPNGGVLNTVGSLGVDADDLAAFDIGPDNEGLAAIRPVGSSSSRLFFIDLPSGSAIDLGEIGKGELIAGLAIQVGPVCTTTP